MNKIELEQHEAKTSQYSSRREKRLAHKNLIAFLQIIENIGPITVAKDDLDMLKDDQLFCNIELLENSESGAEGGTKTVYRNHIQKKLEEFSGSSGVDNDDYQLDGDKHSSSLSIYFISFSNFLVSITIAVILVCKGFL